MKSTSFNNSNIFGPAPNKSVIIKNNPKNNLSKFQTQLPVKECIDIDNEINTWVNKNTEINIKFDGHEDNNIMLTMTSGNNNHIIKITYPKNYPKNKKGFTCQEIPTPNIMPLNFIPKANEKFEDKILSIDRVLTYLSNTFITICKNNNKKVILGESVNLSQQNLDPFAQKSTESAKISHIEKGDPFDCPTDFPTNCPTDFPTNCPTDFPTNCPNDFPTNCPNDFPRIQQGEPFLIINRMLFLQQIMTWNRIHGNRIQ